MFRLALVLIFTFSLYASEPMTQTDSYIEQQNKEDWELYRFNLYFENDLFSRTDSQYSSGEKFNLIYRVEKAQNPLYHLLFLNYGDVDVYISFSLVNQIYTPEDLNVTELIVDDRPYTGWTYVEVALHKSSNAHLRSLYLQVGYIGPRSKSEQIQTAIHKMTGSEPPMGWDNQLKNEIGVNLRYIYKSRFVPQPFYGIETSFIPFVEADLGNISVQASTGISMRIGWNIPKDFGVSSLDTGGEVGIPINGGYNEMLKKAWGFSFNLSGAGSAVIRDIMLDGNSFKTSHSVEKNNFVGYLGYGFSLRYKKFMFEYINNVNSKKFVLEEKPHAVGTVVASWLF